MNLTPEQKEHAVELIEMGEKLDAVRYFQETLQVSAEEALLLAEKLEEEIEETDLEDIKELQQEALKQPGVNVGRLVGMIFMSIGTIMLAVVAYLLVSNYQFMQRAQSVKGKVIDYQSYQSRDRDSNSSTSMYTPTYQYAYKGKLYTHISTTSTSSKDYEIGDPVEILIDPEDPKEILINSFMVKWFLPLLLGFMGTLFTGLGFVAFRFLGKQS